jgi:hypothetical protein
MTLGIHFHKHYTKKTPHNNFKERIPSFTKDMTVTKVFEPKPLINLTHCLQTTGSFITVCQHIQILVNMREQ